MTSMENHKSEIENWDLGAGIYISFYLIRSSLQENDNPMSEMVRELAINVAVCLNLVILCSKSLHILVLQLKAFLFCGFCQFLNLSCHIIWLC